MAVAGPRGNLEPDAILCAYREGWFPMGNPVAGTVEWIRPDPRAILSMEDFHCPRRLARTLRSGKFELTLDREFEGVIDACAERRVTWITPPIREAHLALHRQGHAHSVEAWREGSLVGGVYGVRVGAAFMAESMFHRMRDAGKAALAWLILRLKERGYELLDIQMMTPLMERLGAREIAHREYLRRLRRALERDPGWVAGPT